MAATPVVHLHNHTAHSKLDGIAKIDQMIAAAVANGQPAIAITDHNTLSGTWRFVKEAEKSGIKPILGIEANLAIGSRFQKDVLLVPRDDMAEDGEDGDESELTKKKPYEHLTMLAATPTGWANLLWLTYQSERPESIHYRPRMDWTLLAGVNDLTQRPAAEGIIVGTGCLGGPVAGPIARGDIDGARAAVARLVSIFGRDNVFVEVMDHGIPAERAVIPVLVGFAHEFGLPVVATNDAHYVFADQRNAHDVWLCVGQKRKGQPVTVSDQKRLRFNGSGYHLRTAVEMHALFDNQPGTEHAVANTLWIAEKVHPNVIGETRTRLPKFPVPAGFENAATYLYHEIREGAVRRYGSPVPDVVKHRLRTEFDVIVSKGYEDYFLITWDTINWAKSNRGMPEPGYPTGRPGLKKKILVGAGRGSGAGSAVAYCLGITNVEPIANNLLFERFLAPDRNDFPDFDTDIEGRRREEVVTYLEHRYGKNAVARLGTFSFAWAKRALKDAARATNQTPIATALTKKIFIQGPPKKTPLGLLLDETYDGGADFRKAVAASESSARLVELAQQVEGIVAGESVHPCGIVIGDEPLVGLIPLRFDLRAGRAGDELVTTWDADDAAKFGLVKFDWLFLNDLNVVATALELIEKDTGVTVDVDNLPTDDRDPMVAKTWELLAAGRTAGVFQLAGSGITALTRDVKPRSRNDLSAILALYRPGPMSAGMPDKYARRRAGLEPVDYGIFTHNPAEQQVIANVLDSTLGLCLAEGTKIYSATRRQLVPIEEMKPGELVQSLNEEDGTYVLNPVSAVLDNGERDTVLVTLSSGRSIRLTPDHRVYTPSGWKMAKDLTEQDSIAAPWNLLNTGEELESEQDISRARLLGYLLGDGSFSQGTVSSFVNKDVELHRLFRELISAAFPGASFKETVRNRDVLATVVSTPIRGGNGGSPENEFLKWMRDCGMKTPRGVKPQRGLLSHEKFIPERYLSSPDLQLIKSLIAALWDCDGHIGGQSKSDGRPQAIAFKTTSPQLAADTSFLLQRLGIATTVTPSSYTVNDGGNRSAYQISVLHAAEFVELVVPFMSSRSKVAAALTRPAKGTRRLGSYLSRSSAIAALDLPQGTSALMWWRRKHGRNASYPLAANFIGADVTRKLARNSDSQHMTTLSHSQWQRVRNVEPAGKCRVYDLTVPGTHNFVASGVVVHNCAYQEQLMALAREVSGFNPVQVSSLRTAFSKKKREMMEALFPQFIDGGMSSQHFDGRPKVPFARDTLEKLWVAFDGSSEYLFNASHSLAYGYLTYATAYLKANWPSHYGAALLSNVSRTNRLKRQQMFASLKAEGIVILPPSVNDGQPETTVTPTGAVRIGLSEVVGAGDTAAWIVAERDRNGPYCSLDDLMRRVKVPHKESVHATQALSTSVLEALIEAGACDEFGPRLGLRMTARALKAERNLPVPNAEWGVEERSRRERERLGVVVSEHPLVTLADQLATVQEEAVRGARVLPLEQTPMEDGAGVVVYGLVASVEVKAVGSGTACFLAIEGVRDSIEAAIWSAALKRHGDQLPRVGDIVGIQGVVKIREVVVSARDDSDDSTTGPDDELEQQTELIPSITVNTFWKINLRDPERICTTVPDVPLRRSNLTPDPTPDRPDDEVEHPALPDVEPVFYNDPAPELVGATVYADDDVDYSSLVPLIEDEPRIDLGVSTNAVVYSTTPKLRLIEGGGRTKIDPVVVDLYFAPGDIPWMVPEIFDTYPTLRERLIKWLSTHIRVGDTTKNDPSLWVPSAYGPARVLTFTIANESTPYDVLHALATGAPLVQAV